MDCWLDLWFGGGVTRSLMRFPVHFDLSCFPDTVVHVVTSIESVIVDFGIGDNATKMARGLARRAMVATPNLPELLCILVARN